MNELTCYLAGPWADRAYVREVRDQLVAAGVPINARWIDSHHQDEQEVDTTILCDEAMHDLEDVVSSPVLIVVNSKYSEGKAVELGVALALMKDIILIGTPSNVFHHLPICKVDNVEQAIEAYHELMTMYANEDPAYGQ